jgi:hypothetical protein
MLSNARSRIQDLCSKALTVTDARQIEPILSELKAALQGKVQSGESGSNCANGLSLATTASLPGLGVPL